MASNLKKPDLVEVGVQKHPRSSFSDQFFVAMALAGIVALLYALFLFDGNFFSTVSLEQVATLRTTGTVKRRVAKSLTWQNLRKEGPIFMKDMVYTPPDTRATVTFLTGKSVELTPGSIVQFDESGVDSLEIFLFDLALQIEVPDLNLGLLPLTKPLEDAQAALSSRLRATTHQKLSLRSVRNTVMPDFTLKKLVYYENKLILPEKAKYNFRANRWLQMFWTPIPLRDVVYKIQISTDPKFKTYLTRKTVSNAMILQLDTESDYYWRVLATRGDEKITSQAAEFSMSAVGGRTSPLALRMTSGLTKRYRLEVALAATFDVILSSTEGPDPRCDVSNLPSGKYYCRVTSISTGKEVKTYVVK